MSMVTRMINDHARRQTTAKTLHSKPHACAHSHSHSHVRTQAYRSCSHVLFFSFAVALLDLLVFFFALFCFCVPFSSSLLNDEKTQTKKKKRQ